MSNDFNGNLIPTVGLGFEAFTGDCSLVGRCKCDPSNAPFFIARTREIAICNRCKAEYAIIKIEYDYTKHYTTGPLITIGRVMRTK